MRGGWSRNSALVGALGWTAVCACAGAGKAPLGVIELLFLFAILVIVPLGWVLGEGIAPISSPPLTRWQKPNRLRPQQWQLRSGFLLAQGPGCWFCLGRFCV